ncbi:MAG: prevent-host-death family protein [Deltaproteobacteria bacterium CG_4_9_14_3_um_filter_63_12]|nr:MAG: prevent-host-death family protein [Deltaproteobacteria bacterium CG_4_9_14_3_um_filter_63_12]
MSANERNTLEVPLVGEKGGARTWAKTVAATEAKNEFAQMLELAIHSGPVRITKHRRPRAVLVSIEEYEALMASRRSPLDELSSEFDALLAQMQEPETVAAMDSLFGASPEELGLAAVVGAKG